MEHAFNWKFYVNYYDDLKLNNIDTKHKALNHYYCFGKKESRITNVDMLVDSSYKNHLDVYFYKHIYDPHNNTFKTANDCIHHWLTYGKKEGLINNKKVLSRVVSNNNYKIIKQFKHYNYITSEINNKINILIRTSNRPDLFNTCVNSILNQSYENYTIYATYDNMETLSYIKKYPTVNPISVINKYSGSYHYNLYCNDLLDAVHDGYILFLDDDDMLSHDMSLKIINSQLDKNNIVLWNFFRPDKIIIPNIVSNKYKLGTIANSCICFFYTHKRLSIWKQIQNADYYFIEPILNSLCVKYLNLSLTRTIYTDRIQNHGKIPNITCKFARIMHHENIKKDIEIDLNILDEPRINMFTCKINNNILKKIYSNIHSFYKMISKSNNILLLCYDLPGVGGASNNTIHLHNFFIKTNKKCKTIFVCDDINTYPSICNNNINHITLNNLESVLESIEFEPDIIITKSPIHIDIKTIFKAPVIYLISGIYNNTLNTHYTLLKNETSHNKFINKNVINQIHRSDYVFSNSSHTQDILKNIYKITTNLFYSSVIPFFNKKIIRDAYFNMREYEYGIICSDFTRPIKNIHLSMNKINNKKNVILIGNNSHLFKVKNITTMPYIYNLKEILSKIKFILIDSYYESSSNLQLEALFSGCKLYNDNYCNICKEHFLNDTDYNSHINEFHNKKLTFENNNTYFLQIVCNNNIYEKCITNPVDFQKNTELNPKKIIKYFNIKYSPNTITLFHIRNGHFIKSCIHPIC